MLLRWIEEPDSRDFPLDELIVVTAVVGSEYQRTIDLCTRHVLPRLASHRIRYVQVARPALHTTTRLPQTLT